MRRSSKVAAPLLAATAMAMLSGCRKPEMQRCVDENNHVVDDSFCANLPATNGSQHPPNMHGGGFVPLVPLYRYYYGGWGAYTPGTIAGGGSVTPMEGHSYITSRGVRSGTSRGGFGRWFSSHGFGHGGGRRVMQRIATIPRDNWQQKVEAGGLVFHTPEADTEDESGGEQADRPYWDESAAYEFSAEEIDQLEAAGHALQDMCLEAAQHVVDRKRYAELNIPPEAIEAIEWAWVNSPPSIYGRFDIMYNGVDSPKLLEYNADTPTALLEAAVIQWAWLEEQHPNCDQFNSIHERLIAKWQDIAPYVSKPVYFAGLDNPEDQLTLAYLRDTAEQAGLPTVPILMEEIGWNDDRQAFVDLDEKQMFTLFKLYPWEMMLREEFCEPMLATYKDMRWIEPLWKLLLSNKGLLPILWELFPGHELLLEAHFASSPHGMKTYVRKPLLSREGSNITIVKEGVTIASSGGPYDGPQIVQALAPEAVFADNLKPGASRYPVCGLWIVDQTCCGLGIRESGGPITGNLSSFVPHYFC